MRNVLLVVAWLMLAPCAALAAPDPLHHAAAPRVDASLSLHAVLESAWSRMPEQSLVPAMTAQAKALKRRGRSLLAGPASLSALYRGDQLSSDTGIREMDLGLSVPLWNPGQKHAATGWSEAAARDASSTREALRLQLAGQVRDALWQLLISDKALSLATTDETEAQDLVTLVEKQHRAGDVARADLLLARNYLLEKHAARLKAEATVLDARRVYVALTGLDRRPANFEETEVAAETVPNSHPLLASARAQISVARQALAYTRSERGASPSLTLGVRRERDNYAGDGLNSAYVGICLPLGRSASAAPDIAAAARQAAQAQAHYDRLLRTLKLGLHEAEHTLSVDRATLALNREQAQLGRQRADMTERAYRLGETDIFNLVQARSLAQRARLAAEKAGLQVEWDVASFNQAAGVIP